MSIQWDTLGKSAAFQRQRKCQGCSHCPHSCRTKFYCPVLPGAWHSCCSPWCSPPPGPGQQTWSCADRSWIWSIYVSRRHLWQSSSLELKEGWVPTRPWHTNICRRFFFSAETVLKHWSCSILPLPYEVPWQPHILQSKFCSQMASAKEASVPWNK